MSAKKTHWLRNTIIILLICGVAGLALTAKLFFDNPPPTYAQATIEFTFEGAADGLAPNGSAFNISEIASEDVISAALEAASLQDTYEVGQIQESLVAQGVYPDNMANQVMSYESLLNFAANRQTTITDYHPTTFDIALYNDFDKAISQAQLEGLLRSIMDSYRDYFARVHANGLEKSSMLFDVNEYDYPQRLEIIQGHFSALADYALEMSDKHPTFRQNGIGFNDISVRLNNLIGSDITRLNADLAMNALTQDVDRLKAQYQFEIHNLQNQLEKQNAYLDKLDKLIDSYSKDEIIYVSTANALTRIDSNSSETYDTLVDQRKAVSDSIVGITAQINDYRLKLSDLTDTGEAADPSDASGAAAPGDSADAAEADDAIADTAVEEANNDDAQAQQLTRAQSAELEKQIESLAGKGDAIIDDFQAMLQAYNEQEINDLTVTVTRYDYNAPKVLSGAFVKKAIMTAGPICALGFMLCMALIIASRKREEKRG